MIPATDQAQRPTFPRWTARDQSYWKDRFDAFTEILLEPLTEETEKGDTVTVRPPDEARCVEAVQMAARLADAAIQEMQYRFFIQGTETVRKKR